MPVTAERRYGFGGGLDSQTNPAALRDDELSNVRNWGFDLTGALVTRGGQARVSSTPASATKVTSLFRHYKRDASKYTIFFRNQTMYYQTGVDGTAIDSNAFTATTDFSFATFNDILYYTNGTDTVSSQTMRKAATIGSNTATAPSGSPATKCKYLLASTKMRRLIAAGSSTIGERLYGSALGNGEDWTTSNDAFSIDIVTDDGEGITGICEIAAGILIFKSSSVHLLTGSDPQTVAVQPISTDVGCTSPRSIAANRTSAFFLCNGRVYQTDGAKVFDVSKKIVPTIAAMTSLANAQGIIYKNQYRLYATPSGGTTNTRCLVYYYDQPTADGRRPWTHFDSMSVSAAAILTGDNGELYTGDYAGYINQQDSGTTDFGTGITAYFDTKWDHFKEPERVKKFKTLWVDAEPSGSYNLSVYVSYDGSQNTTVPNTISLTPGSTLWGAFTWGTGTWGGAASFFFDDVILVGTARSILFRFQVTSPAKIYGYTVTLRRKKIR